MYHCQSSARQPCACTRTFHSTRTKRIVVNAHIVHYIYTTLPSDHATTDFPHVGVVRKYPFSCNVTSYYVDINWRQICCIPHTPLSGNTPSPTRTPGVSTKQTRKSGIVRRAFRTHKIVGRGQNFLHSNKVSATGRSRASTLVVSLSGPKTRNRRVFRDTNVGPDFVRQQTQRKF